jgi:sialidase-1
MIKLATRIVNNAALCVCFFTFFTFFTADGAEVPLPKKVLSEKPHYEVWEEEVPNGQIAVAMDGSVLIFKGHGARSEDPKFITTKRSEDGGKTWSEEKKVGETVKVAGDMSDDGRYPHNEWTHLGNVTVDETTGDIMVFMSTLKTAQKLYRSKDDGQTWKMEDTTIKPGADGWMPAINGACDPGVTIKYGTKKGRLVMPARVFVEYLNKGKNRKRFNDLYATALYSDDHGKTWNSSAPFPISGIGESGLVELKDGTIYHNSRTHMRSGNRRIAYSKDAGETWFGEHEDDELFDGPPDEYGCKAALARLRYDDRDILLFCSPGLKDKRHDFTVWVSFDGGKSWPHQKLIKAGPGNYPWMAVGRKGTASENLVYVLAGKDWCARFNLAWLFSDGEYPPAVVN